MNFIYDDVKVLRIIDGDTIEVLLRVDIGFKIYAEMKQTLRLARINTPEITGKEKPQGLISRDYLVKRLKDTNPTIKTSKIGKYGRYVAEIFIDEININDELVNKKLAKYKNYA